LLSLGVALCGEKCNEEVDATESSTLPLNAMETSPSKPQELLAMVAKKGQLRIDEPNNGASFDGRQFSPESSRSRE
jgi:hypothetical protein